MKGAPAVGGKAGEKDNRLQVLRTIAVIFTLDVVIQLIGGSVISFIPIYLVDKHGVTAAYAAMLTGIIRTGGIAGSLLGGWLSVVSLLLVRQGRKSPTRTSG